jgi:hypothetical protein
VRVLLDECVDWRLSRAIVCHDVKTARQMGWLAIRNGELLAGSLGRLRNRRSESVVSANLATWPIAVIVLRARTNRLLDLMPLVPDLLGIIEMAKPGVVHVIGEP